MATNGKVASPRPRSAASRIFDFFKETASFEITCGDEKIPVLFRTLDYGQNAMLAKEMDIIRVTMQHEKSSEDTKGLLMDQAIRLPPERLIEAIMNMERPIAQELADLAPGITPEEREEKEKEAAVKWDANRKAELEALSVKELRDIVIERQMRLLVQSRVLNEFMDQSLVAMVLDPETKEPMFSGDPESEDWIGHVAPEVRTQLMDFRREFTRKKDEKTIRTTAVEPAFLPSGESVSAPVDSPGETTETLSTSPATSPPSTPVAAG